VRLKSSEVGTEQDMACLAVCNIKVQRDETPDFVGRAGRPKNLLMVDDGRAMPREREQRHPFDARGACGGVEFEWRERS
jgi:hypothetical protein